MCIGKTRKCTCIVFELLGDGGDVFVHGNAGNDGKCSDDHGGHEYECDPWNDDEVGQGAQNGELSEVVEHEGSCRHRRCNRDDEGRGTRVDDLRHALGQWER